MQIIVPKCNFPILKYPSISFKLIYYSFVEFKKILSCEFFKINIILYLLMNMYLVLQCHGSIYVMVISWLIFWICDHTSHNIRCTLLTIISYFWQLLFCFSQHSNLVLSCQIHILLSMRIQHSHSITYVFDLEVLGSKVGESEKTTAMSVITLWVMFMRYCEKCDCSSKRSVGSCALQYTWDGSNWFISAMKRKIIFFK